MNTATIDQPNLIQAQRGSLQTPAKHPARRREPVLRFAPLAWLKLRLFLHAGDCEVGCFGIADEDDLLYIQDLALPMQTVSAVTVDFDDFSVADHFEDCAQAGIPPTRCGRLWIHTHPGSSPQPSSVDESTFARVFGSCDWAVMAIVARGGDTYARLSFSAGPGGSSEIPVEVDWERLPQELQDREGTLDELFSGWMEEYGRNVYLQEFLATRPEPIPAKPLAAGSPTVRFYAERDPFGCLDRYDDEDLYHQDLLDQEYQLNREFTAADFDFLPQEVYR